MDHATPNLPCRDLHRTLTFYSALGFEPRWKDGGWMILVRGGIVLEFFPHRDFDPATSGVSCCLRLDDVEAFFKVALAAGVPEVRSGFPRLHRPRHEEWGGLVGALIDLDGTLLRLVRT